MAHNQACGVDALGVTVVLAGRAAQRGKLMHHALVPKEGADVTGGQCAVADDLAEFVDAVGSTVPAAEDRPGR